MATTIAHPLPGPLDPLAEPYLVSTKPSEPKSIPEIVAALRGLSVLDGLSDAEYKWLATHSKERRSEVGALIFHEAEPACHMNIILQGEIQVRRRKTGPSALWIGRAGQLSGKLPFSRMKGYGGDGYTTGPIWVLDVPEDLFPEMLAAIPSMGQRCVSVLLDRVREVTRMEQQSEKLVALGKLAANLAHELNNPASAAQRSAASLFGELREYGDRKYALGAIVGGKEAAPALQAWVQETRAEMSCYPIRGSAPLAEGPLGASDREAAILAWLEQHKVPDAWSIAPTLAEANFPLNHLDDFAQRFEDDFIAPAMGTYAAALRVERMAETILTSTVRIFDLISAIKDYSYMDQAPIQDVDLAQQLEVTLSMFRSRMAGIQLELDFDQELEPVSAYASELNQVWTALIENALDAMPQGGTLRLRTRRSGNMALVEVWDSGGGVPEELQSRIFEPFFTTKAPGRGLGLGLDTAQRIVLRHSGFLTVESKPGETCFQVRLPLDQAQAY